LIIGLDYDETFSADPQTWFDAMQVLQNQGHTVIGVTSRNRTQIMSDPMYVELCDCVIFCAGKSKVHVAENFGYKVDVWIDDKPNSIHTSWEELGHVFDTSMMAHEDLEPFVLIERK
jgi:hypothetical protein